MTTERRNPQRNFRQSDEQFDPFRGQSRTSWHIEKGVSISLIVFLVIQTISIIWFAAQLTGQVKQNTADIADMKAETKERDRMRIEMLSNLSSINQELRDIREIMFQQPSRANQIIMPPSSGGAPAQVIMQAPAPDTSSRTWEPQKDHLSLPAPN